MAGSADPAARLTSDYLRAVRVLTDQWRAMLSASPNAPVTAAATGRSKPQVYRAIELLEESGVLIPLSRARRNRSWEATNLLDLLAGLEAGRRL